QGTGARPRRTDHEPSHRRRSARELARARGHDRGDPQREQALPRARRHQAHGSALSGELRIIPVSGLPEIEQGDDLAALVSAALELEDGDVVVIAQKVVARSRFSSAIRSAGPGARARPTSRSAPPVSGSSSTFAAGWTAPATSCTTR